MYYKTTLQTTSERNISSRSIKNLGACTGAMLLTACCGKERMMGYALGVLQGPQDLE